MLKASKHLLKFPPHLVETTSKSSPLLKVYSAFSSNKNKKLFVLIKQFYITKQNTTPSKQSKPQEVLGPLDINGNKLVLLNQNLSNFLNS